MEKVKSKIKFADKKMNLSFKALNHSKAEGKKLYKWIVRAFKDLEQNAYSGTQISKKLISKIYRDKYDVDNLWKYDLPEGWRLIYSVTQGEVCVLTIILEWMNHKDYERRFKY